MQECQRLACVVGALALLATQRAAPRRIALLLLLACVVVYVLATVVQNRIRMRRVCADGTNEVLLVEARLNGAPCLFLVDTGYAGPPVLSASYLATGSSAGDASLSVTAQYARALRLMDSTRVGVEEQHAAIDSFLATSGCASYTSGCTMRLMSIGATREQQADLLMCKMLQMRSVCGMYYAPKRAAAGADADMFVTHALPQSVHILTCDFLRHTTPCYLNIGAEELHLNMPLVALQTVRARAVAKVDVEFSGGALVVPLTVDGHVCRCTLDTGAPGPVCLGAAAAARIRAAAAMRPTHFRQHGVNGEVVCSDISTASVRLGSAAFDDVPVLANDADLDQVDGYVGLGFLRAFNILICGDGVYFARSGLAMRSQAHYDAVSHEGSCASRAS